MSTLAQLAAAKAATPEMIEHVRQDIAQRIAAMTPKTSATATDVVAILAAIQGDPTSVTIETPAATAPRYGETQPVGWSVKVTYAALTL